MFMKQLKSLVLLLIALFVVSGCQSNELGEKSPYAKNISHLNGLSIELDADIYAPEENQVELTVINHSDEEITYGVSYTLEYLKDDTWYIVEPEEEMSFILIAHILAPGEEASEGINLEYYEPLDEGKYRIIRLMYGGPLAAEFEVVKE